MSDLSPKDWEWVWVWMPNDQRCAGGARARGAAAGWRRGGPVVTGGLSYDNAHIDLSGKNACRPGLVKGGPALSYGPAHAGRSPFAGRESARDSGAPRAPARAALCSGLREATGMDRPGAKSGAAAPARATPSPRLQGPAERQLLPRGPRGCTRDSSLFQLYSPSHFIVYFVPHEGGPSANSQDDTLRLLQSKRLEAGEQVQAPARGTGQCQLQLCILCRLSLSRDLTAGGEDLDVL